jgi:hypothetical protein
MSEELKSEVLTEAESKRIESVFFEDDAEVKLRDGKIYKIPPASLKNARRLMQLLKTVNTDIVLLNFAPTGDTETDSKRENDLFEILSIAFINYPEVTREYLEEYVDIKLASEIIDILIGLNGIKKSKPQPANQE